LFEAASALSQPPAEPSGLAGVEWFERLLASPVYREQRARVRRLQLDDERIRRLLGLLEEHGGKMTCAAVARRLEMPEYRLSGMLAGMRRLLNVDGCSVLEVDESSDTVVFDRKLLETQFGIGPDAL
jgi:hypothetical protein